MSIVKSISDGNGDMFYIKHGVDSFTSIDCCMTDDDHFQHIEYYDERKPIENLYCVKNEATKSDETDSFKKYKEIRDGEKTFYVYSGCSRKWLNQGDDVRKSAGLHFL